MFNPNTFCGEARSMQRLMRFKNAGVDLVVELQSSAHAVYVPHHQICKESAYSPAYPLKLRRL
jgi:hypothetical protein